MQDEEQSEGASSLYRAMMQYCESSDTLDACLRVTIESRRLERQAQVVYPRVITVISSHG